MFSDVWRNVVGKHVRAGKEISPHIESMRDALPTLENVLRIRE